MGLSVLWLGFAALSCLLMGAEVWCDCTENNLGMEGGNYTLTQGLAIGSLLIYVCPDGFYPYPKMTRVCQLNGRWNPTPRRYPPQRCKMVECPDPNVLEYGHVSPPQEKYFVNNETTYECYSGYAMRGSQRRVCLPNGKWSGYTPICSRESGHSCADPGIPPGASRTGNSLEIDDVVRYSCNGNLFLVGSSSRKCQENGQWTGTEPSCYYQYTYDTSLEVTQAFGSAIKETLTTLQPPDDTQEGRKIRISKNGTLNIYVAVDISESIEEKHFNDAKSAVTTLITKISAFPVTPNYEIVFFSSKVHEVVSILHFLDGTAKLNDAIDDVKNFKIGVRNTAGTDLNAVFKFFLERMALIKRQVGEEGFKEHRHVLILFTDGAYNMGGSPLPSVERIKNMVYMNRSSDPDNQPRDEYLDIYLFAIGATIFDADLRPLTAGKDGQHYFRMKDITNLQETFDDIIDEEEVQGLCGLHRDYATSGKEFKRKKYPWYAFIFINNGGTPTRCIGSLVTSRFILTAAHCFKFGDLPEHVKIELNDGQGLEKLVEKFTLHPLYKVNAKENAGVKEFYDYDVALIQLKEDVDISPIARPICIPCTQETSNALKLVGHSTCQQQEQLLLANDLERLSFLTKSKSTVEEKDAHAKLGNNREECISHALGAAGITTTNPRDAVTDNFICTGGRNPYRDHIACQGDSGGAVFKNYEQRTVQVALVSWGTKNLCNNRNHMVQSTDISRDFHINLFRMVPFLKSVLGNDTQDVYAPLVFLEQ